MCEITHEVRGDAWLLICGKWVSPTKEEKKGTHRNVHPLTHAHLPHRAMTKPARLPPFLLAEHCYWEHQALSCVVGWPVHCVCPGGLSCCCCHWPQPSEPPFPILTPGSTQSAASLGHSTTTSSWGRILRQDQSGLPYGSSCLVLSWNMSPAQRPLLLTRAEVSHAPVQRCENSGGNRCCKNFIMLESGEFFVLGLWRSPHCLP